MDPLTANEIKGAHTTDERSGKRLYGSMWPICLLST